MTNFNFNEKIIEIIRESIPRGANLANELMDVLSLGKESVYRRLRGEVAFSLDETARLAEKYSFSVDHILNYKSKSKAFYNLDLLDPHTPIEDYSERLTTFIQFFKQMRRQPDSKVRYALNTLPYVFYLNFENLARFKYFKWLHQSGESSSNMTYSDLIIPQDVLELQHTFVCESKHIAETTIILDRNVFSSMRYDVEYFHKLHLISQDDLQTIKREMLELLDDLEKMAEDGRFKEGSKVALYISNVDLEASYSHFEYADNQYAHLRLYGISGVDSQNAQICNKQRDWIDSLKRYSTLISESGQVQRYDYLIQQRETIERMN